ncbi:Aste57867_8837 [Aphanomyces stellatus]|uniref:Aste57867_8837 protein n=1 Tax=Aphanomyces stellatus TaxID=120398 RepID=A0A485KLH8_9STRA|nr:hypothetical protein As57867_008802 [Aphanomyces stellatus]VFT85723.1 Aste57867_8837 [Aphanomyces stellatus]
MDPQKPRQFRRIGQARHLGNSRESSVNVLFVACSSEDGDCTLSLEVDKIVRRPNMPATARVFVPASHVGRHLTHVKRVFHRNPLSEPTFSTGPTNLCFISAFGLIARDERHEQRRKQACRFDYLHQEDKADPMRCDRVRPVAQEPNMYCPTCRACSLVLEDVRVGIIYPHKDGHILMQWFHMKCIEPPRNLLVSDIEGLSEKCMKPYRAAVFEWLSRQPPSKPRRAAPTPPTQVVKEDSCSQLQPRMRCNKPPLAPRRLGETTTVLPKGIIPGANLVPHHDMIRTMQSCMPEKRHAAPMMMS